MNRGSRSRQINYQIFNSTGEKVFKESSEVLKESSESSVEDLSFKFTKLEINNKMEQLLLQMDCTCEEINDFMEEYPLEQLMYSTEDMDVALQKISNLRSQLRMKHKELLQKHETEYKTQEHEEKYNKMMMLIKQFIQGAND